MGSLGVCTGPIGVWEFFILGVLALMALLVLMVTLVWFLWHRRKVRGPGFPGR